ncbi:hypothetical protein [Lysobacter gummosus]|uniref:hypothetical protein n=1 Tax=Lysobacter gummosus TaxID=262324 RepID=UPI00363B9D7E
MGRRRPDNTVSRLRSQRISLRTSPSSAFSATGIVDRYLWIRGWNGPTFLDYNPLSDSSRPAYRSAALELP